MAKSATSLVAVGTDGAWNVPLLRSAAELSSARLHFADPGPDVAPIVDCDERLDTIVAKHDVVLACETGASSQSVYEFPAPRGRVAVLVGNEMTGLPSSVLRDVDHQISIPMTGRLPPRGKRRR